jgi:hypothetical protein
MAMERNIRIGACLLAVALIGAAGILSAQARPRHAHATKHGGSPPVAADTVARGVKTIDRVSSETAPAAKTQDTSESKQTDDKRDLKGSASGPRGNSVNTAMPTDDRTTTKDTNKSDSQARDGNAIDARITTVAPRHPNGRPDKFRRATKMTRTPPRKFSLARQPGLAAHNRVARNAIGALVAHQDRAHAGALDRGRLAVSGPTTVASLGKTDLGPEPRVIPQPKLLPPGNASVINRGALNGTGLARLGSAGVVGGPAKSISGISGTMFKPKH